MSQNLVGNGESIGLLHQHKYWTDIMSIKHPIGRFGARL